MFESGNTTYPRPSEAALLKHPLHACRMGRIILGARRSDDGLWKDYDGRIMPWFCLRSFGPESGDVGVKVKLGAWIFAVLWGLGDV